MKTDAILGKYEEACNNIVEKINNKYFDGEASCDWVGADIGGVANIADYFFDMDFMVTALKYKSTEKQFFDYYDLVLEKEGKPGVNFKNFIKYYKGLNKLT